MRMSEAGEHAGINPGVKPESRSSALLLLVSAICSFDIPEGGKVDPGEGGMCVALDTSGLGLAPTLPTLLGGAVVGLR